MSGCEALRPSQTGLSDDSADWTRRSQAAKGNVELEVVKSFLPLDPHILASDLGAGGHWRHRARQAVENPQLPLESGLGEVRLIGSPTVLRILGSPRFPARQHTGQRGVGRLEVSGRRNTTNLLHSFGDLVVDVFGVFLDWLSTFPPAIRMSKTFTRTALKQLVWSRPRTTLAKELGISDVAIGKHCARARIPTPPVGCWARLSVGVKHRPVPLPLRLPGQNGLVELGPRETRWREEDLSEELTPPQAAHS